jgi:hypothetical protein
MFSLSLLNESIIGGGVVHRPFVIVNCAFDLINILFVTAPAVVCCSIARDNTQQFKLLQITL